MLARGARFRWLLILALVTVAALLPRFALSSALDPGQPQWTARCQRFWNSVTSGAFRQTFIAPHPGLTLLWLGGAAQPLAGAKNLGDRAVASSRAVALAACLLVVLGTELVRRLLRDEGDPSPATSAAMVGLALAADPLLILTGGLVGLDGLFALLLLCAVLLLLGYWRHGGWKRLAATCLVGGLATATKGPGLVLALLPPLALWPALGVAERPSALRALRTSLALLAGSALVVFLLLPAAWVDPLAVVERLLFGGGRGNESLVTVMVRPSPSYLFGKIGAIDGPAVYLINLLYRATPLVLVGLVAGLFQRRFRASALVRQLGLFALLFLVAISVARQKEWRYMIPFLAAIDALGVLGLIATARSAAARWRLPLAAGVAPALLLVVQAGWVWSGHPYYELMTNPLLGGPRTASHAIQLGWTGGYREAIGFLSSEADRLGRRVTWSGGAFKWKLYKPRHQDSKLTWTGRNPGNDEADCHALSIEDATFAPDETDRLWLARGVVANTVTVRGLDLVIIRCRAERGFLPESDR